MNESTVDRLYQLLPAIYRIGDTDQGLPLRALMATIAQELDILESDLDALYENWFIETCQEWVVPYIGDLVDAQEVYTDSTQGNSRVGTQERRAYVANILAYRRRKGTAPVLEQLTRDVTGWNARVVEFFDRLAQAPHVLQGSAGNPWIDLRQLSPLEQFGSPFEQTGSYTPQVRQITQPQSRYHVAHMGLFIWRLQSYPLDRVQAFAIDQQRFYFNPLGQDQPLFNRPQPETEITQLAREVNLPVKLRRQALRDELVDRQDARLQGQPIDRSTFFGDPSQPVLQIFLDGQPHALSPDDLLISDLSNWDTPQTISRFPAPIVAIDPELGRMKFLGQTQPTDVKVSYAYGFSADVGAGPYNRHPEDWQAVVPEPDKLPPVLSWVIDRSRSSTANPLVDAVQQWNQLMESWEGLRKQTYVPIAKLSIAPITLGVMNDPSLQPRFQPGIVRGLTLVGQVGSQQVIVRPGVAFDGAGRRIELRDSQAVDLKLDRPIVDALVANVVISYRPGAEGQRWQIDVLPEDTVELYPEGTCIPLGRLFLGTGGQLIEPIDTSILTSYTPGIVGGLSVLLNPGGDRDPDFISATPGIVYHPEISPLQAIITSGRAIDSQGQILTLDRNVGLDLAPHQGQVGWIILRHQMRLGEPSWTVQFIPQSEISSLDRTPHVRLAYLNIPQIEFTTLDPPFQPVKFNAGVIKGFNLSAKISDNAIAVSSGIFLDQEGNRHEIDSSHRIPLRALANQQSSQPISVGIVRMRDRWGSRWQIQAFSPSEAPQDPPPIRLGQVTIDPAGRVSSAPSQSPRDICPPSIISGLEVSLAPQGQVSISAGRAIDIQGNLITVSRSTNLDLSAYASQTLILFVSAQIDRGFQPLKLITDQPNRSLKHLGLIPEEPSIAESGLILLRDNGTYIGDLNLTIPSDRRLIILASNGYRPHIRGNLQVRGITRTDGDPREVGELILEGLLIQGALTVQPGDLRRLQLLHSTLVPQAGGLRVYSASDTVTSSNSPRGSSVMALVLYWLTLIERVIQIGLEVSQRSPQENLKELTRIGWQQWIVFLTLLRGTLFPNKSKTSQTLQNTDDCNDDPCLAVCTEITASDTPANPSSDPCKIRFPSPSGSGNNSQLRITIESSIAGPIVLTDSVVSLSIAQSIIDPGSTDAILPGAITAIGTAIDLNTSTVLGGVAAYRLEASDCLFLGKVITRRKQVGCVRFSYLPETSQTPPRYYCQPDRALAEDLNRLPAALTVIYPTADPTILLLGTAGNGLWRSTDSGQSWQPFGEHQTINAKTKLGDLTITALHSDDRGIWIGTFQGTLHRWKAPASEPETIATPNTNTAITAILPYSQPGIGSISSNGAVITGEKTLFTQFQVGDTIAANHETKTITKIIDDQHLEIDSAFSSNLPSNTSFTRNEYLAATASNGIFSFPASGRTWTPFNSGLTNQHITHLTIAPNGIVFATTESGCFRYVASSGQWQAINRGLTSRDLTALAINSRSEIFVGTRDGHIFHSANQGDRWTKIYQGSVHAAIQSLLTYAKPGHGQIQSSETNVTGNGTQFTTDFKVGSTLIVGQQTRLILKVIDDSHLILDRPFSPDLLPNTPFTVHEYLLAGTANGQILRTIDGYNAWSPVYTDRLTQTEISSLLWVTESSRIFATTITGGIFSSQEFGDRWISQTQGLPNVNEKRILLERLQPRLTAEDDSQPGYVQLGLGCPTELCTGAEDGSELGAFNMLQQPQREAALRNSLMEYLRLGLELRFFYMT